MPRGGARPGSGRKPGTANRKTREIADKAAAEGITPLEVMLEVMRDLYAEGEKVAAAAIAKDAAPYIHAKLSQIEQKSEVTVQKAVSGEPLTPEEWATQYGAAAPH
jgi:hypothetical protein